PIFQPMVFIRVAGITGFTRVQMNPVAGVNDLFTAEVPMSLTAEDFDYYIEAFDEDGNGPARVGSPESPLHVSVGAAGPPSVARPAPPPPAERPKPLPSEPIDRPVQAAAPSVPAAAPPAAVAPAPSGKPIAPAIALGALSGAGLITGIVLTALLGGA